MDLYKEDQFYGNLVEIMKIIPAKIFLLKKKDLGKLPISFCPTLQSQRWNSIFISLRYITMNIGAISYLFTPEQIPYLQLIANDWHT